jgi:hypothetical protein
MKIEFFIDIGFQISLAKKAGEPGQKYAYFCHDDSLAGFAKRDKIPAIRSQFAASAASCFLPARVMA